MYMLVMIERDPFRYTVRVKVPHSVTDCSVIYEFDSVVLFVAPSLVLLCCCAFFVSPSVPSAITPCTYTQLIVTLSYTVQYNTSTHFIHPHIPSSPSHTKDPQYTKQI